MSRPSRKTFRAGCEQLEERSLLSALSPAQMRHAYGMDAINYSVSGQTIQGNGCGQTIAIIVAEHNPYLANELTTFDATYGLANPVLKQVDLAGETTNEGWAQEEAMDVEWSHVMAPGASIMVVEAASSSAADLMNAVNYARQQPGVSVVSMSWGSAEFRGQQNYDQFFTTPAGHNGVTFITASGDSGGRGGAQWPASSPNVVAVGGTSLQVDAQGNILSQKAWSGSGGGRSAIVPEPQYQRRAQSTGRRTTPDISLDGDPSSGVPVYIVGPVFGLGYWLTLGGTSLSAQLFAGMVAVADQGRALRGAGTLDGPGQTLPYLYAASSNDFVDITVGSNGHRATRGYDLVSGLGSPVGPTLVADLVSGVSVPVVTGSTRSRLPRFRKAVVRRAEQALARSPVRVDHQVLARSIPGGTGWK
ncbi:MAG: S53 family peptidase [Isosphaeraceae bacterium]